MKIWITRLSAFGIQCGGLERLEVWFSKPEYHLIKLEEKYRDLPFGSISVSEGLYRKAGWLDSSNKGKLSFGKVFGYTEDENSEFAKAVFKKVQEHFLNEPFDNWDELEKEGKCKVEDFLLELEIEPIKVLAIKVIK